MLLLQIKALECTQMREDSANFSIFSGEVPQTPPPRLAPSELRVSPTKMFHSPIKFLDLATGPFYSILYVCEMLMSIFI